MLHVDPQAPEARERSVLMTGPSTGTRKEGCGPLPHTTEGQDRIAGAAGSPASGSQCEPSRVPLYYGSYIWSKLRWAMVTRVPWEVRQSPGPEHSAAWIHLRKKGADMRLPGRTPAPGRGRLCPDPSLPSLLPTLRASRELGSQPGPSGLADPRRATQEQPRRTEEGAALAQCKKIRPN